MRTSSLFLLHAVVGVLGVTLTVAQLPLPTRELGFVYKDGHADAPVKVVAYMDLTCPDSQVVFPTLTAVADYFGPAIVQLRTHLFSLPYHRNSHTLSKGAVVLSQFKSPSNATVYDWIKIVYDNIYQLTTSATANKTDIEVLEVAAYLASVVSGISEDHFVTEVAKSSIDSAARLDFKYGCTRGVYATPSFTVNDIFVDASTYTKQQWIDLITKLIGGPGPARVAVL